MKPSNRYENSCRTTSGKVAERSSEVGDDIGGDLLQLVQLPRRAEHLVPVKVASIRIDGITGEPTLDRNVVQIPLNGLAELQFNTSSRLTASMPNASATAP